MMPDWFLAKKALKEDRLGEFLEKYNLNEDEKLLFIETLNPVLSSTNTIPKSSFKELPSGIFEHYLNHLLTEFKDSEFSCEKIVEDISNNVNETIRRLALRKPIENRPGYGLVIGRIQSGKTAHLIGLIMHALDSKKNDCPYDTIIVLSGLIEDLRKQTLERMRESLEEYQGLHPQILPNGDSDLSTGDTVWLPKIQNHFSKSDSNPMIIVIKKNHIVLEILRNCLPSRAELSNRKVLIIDDEADHASMDTGGDETIDESGEEIIDENPSETNRQLRLLIKQFQFSKSCWYIGYTATPFANLLSHPWSSVVEDEYGLSLHPRDMLHALGKPRGHYDNEQYFLQPDAINVIIKPIFHEYSEEENEEIKSLVARHILTNEIKKLRGLNKHHTTLIHTAVEVEEHRRIASIARLNLENFFSEPSNAKQIYNDFKELMKEYYLPIKEENELYEKLNGMLLIDFDSFMDIIDSISVVEVNRRTRLEGEFSPQELDYSSGPRSYIAVGGTRLSRGLTLQGLTTSWFSRRANEPKYDTMLQMSRWCGYRPEYSDLVRILTTEQIRMDFVRITNEEHDLRRKIQSLPENVNPIEEEIWIREHPGMHLTSPEKKAEAISRTWGGLSRSNVWSWASPEINDDEGKNNIRMFEKTNELISKLDFYPSLESKNEITNFSIKSGVNGNFVREFLINYHDLLPFSGNSDTKNDLRKLIEDNEWLPIWNVAIHTPNTSKHININGKEIGLVNRSTTESGNFSIIQSSANDSNIDIDENQIHRIRPLLILYLIDPDSTQGNYGIVRTFSNQVKKPVTSFAICLPTQFSDEGGFEYTASNNEF